MRLYSSKPFERGYYVERQVRIGLYVFVIVRYKLSLTASDLGAKL